MLLEAQCVRRLGAQLLRKERNGTRQISQVELLKNLKSGYLEFPFRNLEQLFRRKVVCAVCDRDSWGGGLLPLESRSGLTSE